MASKIVFSVSELNQATQGLLEEAFPAIWVEGEISNLRKYPSGHVYFSLKDQKAQLRCVFFRREVQRLPFELNDGLLIQLQGKVSLYTERGDYQLIASSAELAGDGRLKKAFDLLVKKLNAEGLFDQKCKKPLPPLPKKIGIISSSRGAALQDILSVLKRRFPSIPIFIYPSLVQGAKAADEIVRAIAYANKSPQVDVLILSRGGGSLEDLWPFNEESVARAIFASKIPIISGVGHEIDTTIADMVADQRAPTPSAAAELITPDQNKWLQNFSLLEQQLCQRIALYLQHRSQKLDWLQKRLQHPGDKIKEQLAKVAMIQKQLTTSMQRFLRDRDIALKNAMRTLQTVSPLNTLERGYAIVFEKSEEIIRSVKQVKSKDEITIKLKDGSIKTTVN